MYHLRGKEFPNNFYPRCTCLLLGLVFQCLVNAATAQVVQQPDSILAAIAPAYDQVSKRHRFYFGEGYRKVWAAPVKFRVFDPCKERGGMRILKKGGGMQTKSLRLQDTSGREWVVRSIQKYPEQGLPAGLKSGLAKDILQDQVITAHPFAALTVPVFAEALGLPHATPEMVYLHAENLPTEYRGEFGNGVFLLEQRAPTESDDTDNTLKAQRELEEDNDTRVDQALVLRARLLDMVLGDWDRHADQWRWDKKKDNGDKVYTPVARDRDMVYYHTTGILPWIVAHQWLKSKFQGFHPTIRDTRGFNVNNVNFDRYFLNQCGAGDWTDAIAAVQQLLTDSLVNAAIHRLPDTVFALSGERLIYTIKARRNNLPNYAMEYYRFLSREVDIAGSGKRESALLQYLANGSLAVIIRKIKKDNTAGHILYQREFEPATTKEVRLHGLAGDDVFNISGNAVSSIRLRLIGGEGKDSLLWDDRGRNKNNVFIYDQKNTDNYFAKRRGVRLRLSSDSMVHHFNKGPYLYDRFATILAANYNPDDAILLKAGFSNIRQGFRKLPYSFFNELQVNYSVARQTWHITYIAMLKEFWGKNDLGMQVYARGPRNLSNFFGLGNNTLFEKDGQKGIEYYRSRYDYVNMDLRLYRNITPAWRLSVGPAFQFYTSKEANNKGRFFDKYNVDYPLALLYSKQWFAGAVAGATYDTRDHLEMPSRGVNWTTTFRGMQQTNGENNRYGQVLSEFSWFTKPIKAGSLVLAHRVGAGTTRGNPAFFQYLYLGGKQTLRGFNTNRFAGKSILYNNLEARMKLFDFNGYLLPGTVGLIMFNDVGRVWLPDEQSKRWHTGYGAGLYIIPAHLLVIQGTVGFSKENILPYISLGFRF